MALEDYDFDPRATTPKPPMGEVPAPPNGPPAPEAGMLGAGLPMAPSGPVPAPPIPPAPETPVLSMDPMSQVSPMMMEPQMAPPMPSAGMSGPAMPPQMPPPSPFESMGPMGMPAPPMAGGAPGGAPALPEDALQKLLAGLGGPR